MDSLMMLVVGFSGAMLLNLGIVAVGRAISEESRTKRALRRMPTIAVADATEGALVKLRGRVR